MPFRDTAEARRVPAGTFILCCLALYVSPLAATHASAAGRALAQLFADDFESGDTAAWSSITGPPIHFHCHANDTCPEVLVLGDPHATIEGMPSPFRGYGDPSLERDPATEELWLSYTWLDVLVTPAVPAPLIDLGARTHLAVSIDGGHSFTFERAANQTTRGLHPVTGVEGFSLHEVSTLIHDPDPDPAALPDSWQLLWLEYFEPAGPATRSDFLFSRSRATSPRALGDTSERWARGWATAPEFGAAHDLSEIPQLADCAVLTEPALFSENGVTYLAAHCIVVEDGIRLREQERLVLLREQGDGLTYVGVLLDSSDAHHFAADTLEQADLSYARDGSILLIVTPIRADEDPQHQGCVVLEISDLAAAQVRRDVDGAPSPRAVLTADGNGLGPGLCAYDRDSATGVLLVITSVDLESEPVDILFSLRATGIHP